MKTSLSTIIFLLFAHIGVSHAQDNPLQGVRLGFAFDRGFGLTATKDDFNGFIGNDGFALDYIVRKEPLKLELQGEMQWYLGGGGYLDWDGDFGARLPVGAEWHFSRDFDLYVQVMPGLQFADDFKFVLDAALGVRYQF